jgi:hypothetical protein
VSRLTLLAAGFHSKSDHPGSFYGIIALEDKHLSQPAGRRAKQKLKSMEEIAMTKLILRASALFLTAATLFVSGCDGILTLGDHLPSGTPIWVRTTVGGTPTAFFRLFSIGKDGF